MKRTGSRPPLLAREIPFKLYIYIYIYNNIVNRRFHQLLKCSIGKLERCVDLQSWIIWSKTFIATQSFMLLAEQSSGNCQKQRMHMKINKIRKYRTMPSGVTYRIMIGC